MMRSGFVADGVFKLLVAVALVVFMPALEEFFLSPRWLVITAAVLLFLSAATEISFGVRKGERRYVRHLAIFDILWIIATVVGIVLAFAGNVAGGYVWFGYTGLASLFLAVVFTTGANGPDFGDEENGTDAGEHEGDIQR